MILSCGCCPRWKSSRVSYRFTLGDRLVAYGLDLLLVVVASAYAADKAVLLEQASARVNGLRYLLRLAKDLLAGDRNCQGLSF
jgi:hypothetical protein